MTKSNDAIFVESAVLPGTDIRQDIAAELGDQRVYTLMGAALALAVAVKFPDSATSSEVAAFVNDMKERYPEGAEEFDGEQIEKIIRGIRGETELLDNIDPNFMADMSFMLTYAIISGEGLSDADMEEYVSQVIEVADAH
ncbi:MAG TPA: hypothetical protein H9902_13475 [Candidatus Stackebrandtia faecavium]|nr:hypothetical protein [Candidatus Stackebrandtia faecavium]